MSAPPSVAAQPTRATERPQQAARARPEAPTSRPVDPGPEVWGRSTAGPSGLCCTDPPIPLPDRRSTLRHRQVEFPLEVPDLIPQLGRVFEAQILGGGEHFLLQLDDRLLELGWGR